MINFKKVLATGLVLGVLYTGGIDIAQAAKPVAQPYLDINNPSKSSYKTKFKFLKTNTEKVIEGSKDGKVTVTLNNLKLSNKNRKVSVALSLYYRSTNNKYWKCPKKTIKRFTVYGNKERNITFTFRIPKDTVYYVRLTKNKHIKNYVSGSMIIKD